jgi:hypothetical protein
MSKQTKTKLKKAAIKVAKKKPVKKVARKKVVTKKKVTPKPKVASSRFAFEPIVHPKFPELVIITKAPSYAKHTIGKRYLNSKFAEKMIAEITAEHTIDSSKKVVKAQIKESLGEEIISTEISTAKVNTYDVSE